MLPRRFKIGDRHRIEYAIKKGRRISGGVFQFRYLLNKLGCSRFAVVVSKKISKKAVERNVIRRRVYEALSQNLHHLSKTCYDVVVLISPTIIKVEFSEIVKSINISLKKLSS